MSKVDELSIHRYHMLYVCGRDNEITYNIDPPLRDVISVEVSSALIPRSEYTIEPSRDTFYYTITKDGVIHERAIQVSQCDYSAIELAEALTLANTDSLTFMVHCGRICITGKGEALMIYGDYPLNEMLGYHENTYAIKTVPPAARKRANRKNLVVQIESDVLLDYDYISTEGVSLKMLYEDELDNMKGFVLNGLLFEEEVAGSDWFVASDIGDVEGKFNLQYGVGPNQDIRDTYPIGIKFIRRGEDYMENRVYITVRIVFIIVNRYVTDQYNMNTDDYSYFNLMKDKFRETTQNYTIDWPIAYEYGMKYEEGYGVAVKHGPTYIIGDMFNSPEIPFSMDHVFEASTEEGDLKVCGERYNLSGCDVVLLESNLDGFINGGKLNNLSLPLAKFYINHEENSMYLQSINYDQPSRTFFPISKLDRLELRFMQCHRYCNTNPRRLKYQFHKLCWNLQIVVTQIEGGVGNGWRGLGSVSNKEIMNKITDITKKNEIYISNRNYDTDKNKTHYKKYILAPIIMYIVYVIYRRVRLRND